MKKSDSPKKVQHMFNSGGNGNGYSSCTDDSENGSPLRGPRYLPVYDTPLAGATLVDDHYDDGESDSDHEEGNGHAVNNIPIHYKAMALSRHVAWKLSPESTVEGDSFILHSRTYPTADDPPQPQRKRGRHFVNLLLIGAFALGIVAVLLLRGKVQHQDTQHFRPTKELTSDLPFPAISRSSLNGLGSPDNLFDMDLFIPDMKKTLLPFPTGAFWTNFVLKNSQKQNGVENGIQQPNLSNPIVVYPYAFKWSHDTLALSYPSYRRIVQPLVIQDVFWPDLSISASEGVVSRKILSYDHLSVTIRLNSPRIATQNEAVSFFDTYMVQGSPYVTSKFTRASPKLTALSVWDKVGCVSGPAHHGGLCSIEKAADQNFFYLALTGVQFLITQAEGQQWILFVNGGNPITFFLTADRRTIVSAKPYTGVIRIALVPPGADLEGSTVMNLLNHSAIYPVSAKVQVDYNDVPKTGSDVASVTFSYETVEGASNNDIDLLMLALPHHKSALEESKAIIADFDADYRCIKGTMIPVVGNEWTAYVEPLTDLRLGSNSKITNSFARDVIKKNIEVDRNLVIPSAGDVYGFGKEIARLAQLALLADELEMDSSIVKDILDKVEKYLTGWLDGDGPDDFVFDKDLGGIVTRNGLQNPGADFGNGWYNDHHFHYGYYIYAASILSRFSDNFLQNYTTHIYTLIHDIANQSPVSPNSLMSSKHNDEPKQELYELFPSARHKSWYDGHSWASGLFQQANGKGQESSSEAVNAYFATYLWQKLNGSRRDMNFARLLLATEIRAAKTYWHTGPTNELYPNIFANNYMVGNMGGLDATCTTWFGNKMSYVHLINFLPVTDITNDLFSRDYVEGEYKFLEPYISNTEEAWQGYLAALNAIIDPGEAWDKALDLESYLLDSALSKSQVLHWIASKPGLGSTWNISIETSTSSCSAHTGCSKLSGDCCPTKAGVRLGCCDE